MKAYYESESVQHAVQLRLEHPQAHIIAGGSDVLVQMREGKRAGVELISIFMLDELRGVSIDADENIRIGSLTSFSHITKDPIKDFYLKAKVVDIRDGEIQTAILISKTSYENTFGYYIKYAMRNTLDIATNGCSVNVRLSEDKKPSSVYVLHTVSQTPSPCVHRLPRSLSTASPSPWKISKPSHRRKCLKSKNHRAFCFRGRLSSLYTVSFFANCATLQF